MLMVSGMLEERQMDVLCAHMCECAWAFAWVHTHTHTDLWQYTTQNTLPCITRKRSFEQTTFICSAPWTLMEPRHSAHRAHRSRRRMQTTGRHTRTHIHTHTVTQTMWCRPRATVEMGEGRQASWIRAGLQPGALVLLASRRAAHWRWCCCWTLCRRRRCRGRLDY